LASTAVKNSSSESQAVMAGPTSALRNLSAWAFTLWWQLLLSAASHCYFAFFYQFYSILARTNQDTPGTAAWLIAIDIVFAAPIFYAIYKYIPKQNHLKVEK